MSNPLTKKLLTKALKESVKMQKDLVERADALKCECAKMTCNEPCPKDHTHKTFFCEKCQPVLDKELKETGSIKVTNTPNPQEKKWKDEYCKKFGLCKDKRATRCDCRQELNFISN